MSQLVWIDAAKAAITLGLLSIVALYLAKSIIWFVIAGKRTIDVAQSVRRETIKILAQAEAEPQLPSNRGPRRFSQRSVARRTLNSRAASRAVDLKVAK